jgi:hypothetical protein
LFVQRKTAFSLRFTATRERIRNPGAATLPRDFK